MKYNKLFLENVSPIKSTLRLSCIMSQIGQTHNHYATLYIKRLTAVHNRTHYWRFSKWKSSDTGFPWKTDMIRKSRVAELLRSSKSLLNRVVWLMLMKVQNKLSGRENGQLEFHVTNILIQNISIMSFIPPYFERRG